MAQEHPYLMEIDPEHLAGIAREMLVKGEETSHTDLGTCEYSGAGTYASLALLSEVHRIRLALEKIAEK